MQAIEIVRFIELKHFWSLEAINCVVGYIHY